jgi:hypothetical protein
VLLLGPVEVCGWVAGQVGPEEGGRLRQGDAEVGLPPHSGAEPPARAVEEVAARPTVVGQAVQVVAGHQDRLEVARRPEADEGAADAGHIKLLLTRSRRDEFTEAICLVVNCKTPAEVDHFWQKLSAGGQEVQCGWLKDKFGVSWQVVPTVLPEMLQDGTISVMAWRHRELHPVVEGLPGGQAILSHDMAKTIAVHRPEEQVRVDHVVTDVQRLHRAQGERIRDGEIVSDEDAQIVSIREHVVLS